MNSRIAVSEKRYWLYHQWTLTHGMSPQETHKSAFKSITRGFEDSAIHFWIICYFSIWSFNPFVDIYEIFSDHEDEYCSLQACIQNFNLTPILNHYCCVSSTEHFSLCYTKFIIVAEYCIV